MGRRVKAIRAKQKAPGLAPMGFCSLSQRLQRQARSPYTRAI
jgi:hypothetical protein